MVGVQGFEPYAPIWSRWQDSNLRHPAPKAGGMNQTILHRVYTSQYVVGGKRGNRTH